MHGRQRTAWIGALAVWGFALLAVQPAAGQQRAPSAARQESITLLREAAEFEKEKKLELAERRYDDAIKADPTFAPAYHQRALFLRNQKQVLRALVLFDKAIALAEDTAKGIAAEAVADPVKARDSSDIRPALHYDRGFALWMQKDFESAAADFARSFELDMSRVESVAAQGMCLTYLGKGGEADAAIAHAIALRPALKEQIEEQKKEITAELARAPLTPPAELKATRLFGTGRVRALEQDWAGAIADFDEASRLLPASVMIYVARADVRMRAGDRPAALADIQTALQLDAKSAAAYLTRGNYHFTADDFDRALADADRALAIDSKLAQAHALRGFCLLMKGRDPEANAAFDQAVKIVPGLKDSIAQNAEALKVRRTTRAGAKP
jgi:tetratricopeptide (TPR) repeat protein